MQMRRTWGALAVLAALLPFTATAQQQWPTKAIRIIVPLAAGSVTDVVMRAAAQEIQPRLGQPILIDNKPGASAIVGTEACARAAPDGYTLCSVYFGSMSLNPHTTAKLPYDPEKDFAPIAKLFQVTEGLFVPATLPVSTVAELRAYAAKNPAAVNFGTLGEGSLQEMMLAWVNHEWKTSIVGVAYKGGGPISTALAAGEIQLAQMGIGNFTGVLQAGKVKPLAVSAEKRTPSMPQVPTLKEAGLDGFSARVWWGLAAPAGTPSAVVQRVNAEFVRVFQDPKFIAFLEERYIESTPMSPQQFAAFMKTDREQAGALVKLAQPAR
ncbi:tripartite tricarboxylate transporter substrate binding protein [Ramlibacter sp. G-1-2-2]|uniref:Tripartite tricarboxylate transporter substrate binding protein n=1 Tax=Ramlibacter agri TaxID=2728837 RepID=A0A848H1C5_9BURK|nr:tripartite tricarboxylate transporter substrate binding protein [Ramlibacter agri]NML43329.1 tripartite tricarboxylate transporter substrate binding protein [Ramlibacter agri]